MNMRRTLWSMMFRSVVCGLWFMALLPTASASMLAPVDTNETWTAAGTAGWTHGSAEVTLTNPGGYLNMGFMKQSIPMCISDITWKPLRSGIILTNLSFRFRAFAMAPSEARLYLYSSRSGRMWHLPLAAPAVGQWSEYRAPVEFSAGWITGLGGAKEQFDQDIQSVEWVGVYVRRHSSPAAQNYGIDDFRMQGYLSPDADTDGDGMPDAWEIQYGLDPNDPSDAGRDNDKDGVSNAAECRAGTDPTRADSVFTLEAGFGALTDSANGAWIVLRWHSVEGRTYSVWRTEDLRQGFVRIESGIPGTPPVNEYRDNTATQAGPYYYKVGVR